MAKVLDNASDNQSMEMTKARIILVKLYFLCMVKKILSGVQNKGSEILYLQLNFNRSGSHAVLVNLLLMKTVAIIENKRQRDKRDW